jgi:hypothetical protein
VLGAGKKTLAKKKPILLKNKLGICCVNWDMFPTLNGFQIMIKIAVILPFGRGHYTANTLLDGLFSLRQSGRLDFKISPDYPAPFSLEGASLSRELFSDYAKEADLIFLVYAKHGNNMELARSIDCFHKTIFIDGSELGGDRRYDAAIARAVVEGRYEGDGAIHAKMQKECPLYFRREKPYLDGIIPFPFGIERRYVRYNHNVKKDIDFVCIFGQEEYPALRKEAKEWLVAYCKKEGLVAVTEQTKGFSFDDATKKAGREDYYDFLARAKVGVSIGGGGFDTARFWEVLANNCILLTESIDIYEPGSHALSYSRIHQFKNMYDFAYHVKNITAFLRSGYDPMANFSEYENILSKHSSLARVEEILSKAKQKNLIS